MGELLLLIAAGFVSGMLNAVAGGGTFVSLPALIWTGVPPVSANATATLSALPGYAAGAWGFRHDILQEGDLALRTILLISGLGSIAGALLLIVTPGDAFLAIVPWLLLLATALFAGGPAILRAIRRRGVSAMGPAISVGVVLAVSIYGGYFNGGLGIMLLAAFGLIGYTNLHAMNGLKNVLSALLSLVSSVAFVLADMISWHEAGLLAASAALGGYVGARVSRGIRRLDLLRMFITGVGTATTIAFFLR
ncbi:sulfite exporter TauE/SafE family protein [Paracoccus sp. YLB-12]|uniref:Probable membrane transporter protein n=2 Tax=Paracoccus maritimus TaxID=2933292 RepID=A0ABT2KEC0_9RHOB|nr:sulfite exporter TauE/SafE family protein [Paracoccus sp. YLB-12]MCT4334891.1 sulfite exporter TauE/SafE family protein [Paracoccus sp. YLB-12]